MDRSKILDKIRKLQALAGDRAATPDEAAAAAAAIRRIMAEHGLDEADAAAAGISIEDVELHRTRRQTIDQLAGAVAGATGCVHIMQVSEAGLRVRYVGPDPAPVIAAYLHDVCYRAVEAAAEAFRRSDDYRRRRKAKTRAAAVKTFKGAMIERLRVKLYQLHWLTPAQREELTQAYSRRTGAQLRSLAPVKAISRRARYADALRAGNAAGRAVDINQPIATGGEVKLVGAR